MKDLTDFLHTSTNASNSTNSVTDKTKSECEIKIQTLDNQKTVPNSNVKKRKKKKVKRKPSDPAVKNIVDLLSTSLCIISPNTSVNDPGKQEVNEIVINDQDESNSVTIIVDQNSQTDSSSITTENENDTKSKNKVNAFQFMMDSRNKSIGQNSPGKERIEDDNRLREEKDTKVVLSARRSFLQSWNDKKGGSKRKREEEEKEEIINHKLEKRAKRLKKLLHVEKKGDKESDVIIKKTKKRIKKISSSSSEDTKDSIEIIEESKQIITNTVLEVIEENAQDVELGEVKPKERRQSLLTFFGVVTNTKKTEECSPGEAAKENTVTKIKSESSKLKKSKSNNSETIKKSLKSIFVEESSNEELKLKKSKSKKKKKHLDEDSQDSDSRIGKTTKSSCKDDGDGNFTPRSLKSWKMKIKLNEEDSEKVQNEEKTEQKRPQRLKKVVNYKLLLDEDSNQGDTETHKPKRTTKNSDEIVICSDDETNKPRQPVKVAPVFSKAAPKPKLAPEVIEARKQFLMSGIPDSLKKTMEKQQSIDEQEYTVFPSVSHVQQKCDTQRFWTLSSQKIDLKSCSPLKIEKPIIFSNLTNCHITDILNIKKEVEKVDKLKTLLNKIKLDNPNYPVYKSFRLIYEKNGKSSKEKKEITMKSKKRRKRRSKNIDESIEIVEEIKSELDSNEFAMWTDKYKPRSSDDIIGNTENVTNLKKWLELWKNFSEEIISRKKNKRDACSSDSEFDMTDCDSRDSTKLPGNTLVVEGPCGCGKTTAIYAICNELGFNVIELNASSKRTGKRLILDLQEATQSHQVRKKERLSNFFQSKEKVEVKERVEKKMCVLLIEDVDLVFEQDDGFISALTQLVNTSKRPIILTTTDSSSVFVQKFISQYEFISFLPLSAQSLATWLQIVCLVEGLYVNQGDIGGLLEFNRGDVRKTLLQLQFWVQSGGQIVRDDLVVKSTADVVDVSEKVLEDEQEPPLEDDFEVGKEIFIHSNCIRSFEIFKHHKLFRVPYQLNLGFLWWNIPNILGYKRFSEQRINRFKENCSRKGIDDLKSENKPQKTRLSPIEKRKLHTVSKLYDSLAFADILFKSVNYTDSLEPQVKNYSTELRNSLELSEVMDGYDGRREFVHEITHDLVNSYLEKYNDLEKCESLLNFAVPGKAERRWRAKIHVCEDVFLQALPLSSYTERRSIALDYMPSLRDISRSECARAAHNTKRGNRFRNYLRSVGINYNDSTLKLACNILTMNK